MYRGTVGLDRLAHPSPQVYLKIEAWNLDSVWPRGGRGHVKEASSTSSRSRQGAYRP
jgi:hypothetical protein